MDFKVPDIRSQGFDQKALTCERISGRSQCSEYVFLDIIVSSILRIPIYRTGGISVKQNATGPVLAKLLKTIPIEKYSSIFRIPLYRTGGISVKQNATGPVLAKLLKTVPIAYNWSSSDDFH